MSLLKKTASIRVFSMAENFFFFPGWRKRDDSEAIKDKAKIRLGRNQLSHARPESFPKGKSREPYIYT